MPAAERIELSSRTSCPSAVELRQYLAGWTEDAQAESLEDHLQCCSQCDLILKELESSPETLLQSMKSTVGISVPDPGTYEVNASAVDSGSASLPENETPINAALEQVKKLVDVAAPISAEKASTAWHPAVKELGIYELIRPLGRGGMGAVYLALHRPLRKQVAIKLLPLMSGEDSDVRARFEREIRVVGRLNHPSIVAATDAGEIDGTQFLVMEYVPGMDLSRLARLMGRLAVADSCELIRQVALGLSCAHAEGVVHRDVKPSNLMLDESGRIRILDFGLAQLSVWDEASVDLTTVGQLMGTLDYMAPEQAELSGNVDYRADLYALGATLFRLLCGRPPLAAAPNQSPLEKLRLLANHQPPKLNTLCPEAPSELVMLVSSMLARNPQDRPASAAHVAEQLGPMARGSKLVELLECAKQKAAASPEQLKKSLLGDLPTLLSPAPVATATSALVPKPGEANNGRGKTVRRLLLAASLPLMLLAGLIIKLELDKGQLVIESDVDNVHVSVLRDAKRVEEIQISHGATSTRLQADNYEITIDSASDGLEIINDRFTLKNGETVIARIRRTVASTEPSSEIPLQSTVRSADVAAPSDALEAMRFNLGELDVKRQLLETKLGSNHPQVLELRQEIEIRHAQMRELTAEREKANDISKTELPLYDGKPLDHWLDMLGREKSAAGLLTAFEACSALTTEENGEQIANVVLKVVPGLNGELNLRSGSLGSDGSVDWFAAQLLKATLPGPKFCSRWVTEFEAGDSAWQERLWKSYAPDTSRFAPEDVEPFISWTEHRLLKNAAEGKDPDQDSLRAANQLRNMISLPSQRATDAFRSRVMRILAASTQLSISWWLSQPLLHRIGDDYYEVWPADYKMEVTRRAIEALQNDATLPSLVVQASIILANSKDQSDQQRELISAAIGRRLEALAKEKLLLTQMVQTAEEFSKLSDAPLDTQSPLYLAPVQIEVRRSWVRETPMIENSVALTLLNHAWKLDKGISEKSQLDDILKSTRGTLVLIQPQMMAAEASSGAFSRAPRPAIKLHWPDLQITNDYQPPGGLSNLRGGQRFETAVLWGKYEPTKQDWLEYLILLHPVMTERVTEALKEIPATPAAEAAPAEKEVTPVEPPQ